MAGVSWVVIDAPGSGWYWLMARVAAEWVRTSSAVLAAPQGAFLVGGGFLVNHVAEILHHIEELVYTDRPRQAHEEPRHALISLPHGGPAGGRDLDSDPSEV